MIDKELVKKKLKNNGHNNIVEVSWPQNHVNIKHSHPWDAEIIVLYGNIKIMTGDKEYLLQSGDEFKLKADIEHSEYVGDEGVTFLSLRPTDIRT